MTHPKHRCQPIECGTSLRESHGRWQSRACGPCLFRLNKLMIVEPIMAKLGFAGEHSAVMVIKINSSRGVIEVFSKRSPFAGFGRTTQKSPKYCCGCTRADAGRHTIQSPILIGVWRGQLLEQNCHIWKYWRRGRATGSGRRTSTSE